MKRRISILGFTALVFLSLLGARPMAQNTSSVYQTAKRPQALALIGDRYHSPVYIRDGLAPAFLRENIPVTFIENVEALVADSLKDFQLLVILRDGMNWPNGYEKEPVKWMTENQQQAVWDFVHNGVDSSLYTMLRASTLPAGSTTSCLAATTADILTLLSLRFAWKTKPSS